ncbi:PREDICTED: serine/threonine-protein phosphatase 7 long form homolog [Erythranthe guttata]|uniref:serine/threonine-protein phosphatase 7 long form homolog n=1 Tax=Erythranthe guttata TaxID=4155 RepID=UPI00064DFF33|nr:PREDICTED: serine/threonine-protein phosphatase 7 long form homolog [Erythranthe guttata]|eukprot:XP_012845957.1 PREDICTED: serine/threonine-protein phosphatase 7 long form homolog [Erythranthe guttata]
MRAVREEAEHQERERERMTMSTRRRREAERAGEARSSVPHPDVGSSRAMEEEEYVAPVHETEVVGRGGRRGRGGRGRGRGGRPYTRVNPDVLDGPFPGGPRDPSLIPSFKSHVAAYIWRGEERPVGRVESRINSLNQFNYEKIADALEDVDVSVDKHFLRMTGLYPLARCYLQGLDIPLLFAFVERWQPETNSFHMPWGEMTITLHDVQMILGANVEGRVVAPRYDDATERTNCVYLLSEALNLEFEEIDESWKHGGPTWRMLQGQLLMPDTPMRRRVQIYLVFLLGSILFPDKTCDRVKPWYMHVLEDSVLDQVGTYSWGSACLANLYRELGICSRAQSRGLAGCTTLLQCWIYEYFPRFQPPDESEHYREFQPRCKRWNAPPKAGTLEHIRGLLDNMTADDVEWLPYGRDIHESIPRTLYHGTIQYMWVVEPYMPDRCVRQFGWVQDIPRGLIPSMEPCSRGPKGGTSYKVNYPFPGGMWDMVQAHSIHARAYKTARQRGEVDEHYMEWYTDRTHPKINNPDVGPAPVHRENVRPPDQPAFYQVVRALYPITRSTGQDWMQQFADLRADLGDIMQPAARYLGIDRDNDDDDDDDDDHEVQPPRRARR